MADPERLYIAPFPYEEGDVWYIYASTKPAEGNIEYTRVKPIQRPGEFRGGKMLPRGHRLRYTY